MSYRHIDDMEQERIAAMLPSGERAAAIACALGRARSSVTQQLAPDTRRKVRNAHADSFPRFALTAPRSVLHFPVYAS